MTAFDKKYILDAASFRNLRLSAGKNLSKVETAYSGASTWLTYPATITNSIVAIYGIHIKYYTVSGTGPVTLKLVCGTDELNIGYADEHVNYYNFSEQPIIVDNADNPLSFQLDGILTNDKYSLFVQYATSASR